MSDPNAPGFAMRRAVEILANIYERAKPAQTPPVPLDRPLMLFSEAVALTVGMTTRSEVECALGVAFAYPVRGFHTYCCTGRDHAREFLSIFYRNDRVVSVELYLPKSERAPSLAPRAVRFRIVPGEIAIGAPMTSLPAAFAPIASGGTSPGAFSEILGAAFPGGSAYAMGNKGLIERLALYGGA